MACGRWQRSRATVSRKDEGESSGKLPELPHVKNDLGHSNEIWVELVAKAGDRVIGRSGGIGPDGESFDDPREFPYGPMPREWMQWKGLYRQGDRGPQPLAQIRLAARDVAVVIDAGGPAGPPDRGGPGVRRAAADP